MRTISDFLMGFVGAAMGVAWGLFHVQWTSHSFSDSLHYALTAPSQAGHIRALVGCVVIGGIVALITRAARRA